MSKDMLGPVVRAAVGVPQERCELLAKIASDFAGNNPRGEQWYTRYKAVREAGLPDRPKPAVFSVVATTRQGEIAEKPTRECFTNYAFRDPRFDSLLLPTQKKSDVGVVAALSFERSWQFAGAARALPGVMQTKNIAALGHSLIRNGYPMTLPQVEDIVMRTKRGEPTGMLTDGRSNVFFVETGNSQAPVAVCLVERYRSAAVHAFLYGLSHTAHCVPESRLFVRNLDA